MYHLGNSCFEFLISPNISVNLCSLIFRPFFQQCFYCTMEYDIIGRLEDYHEDILYIAQLQNFTSRLGDLSEVKNRTPGKLKIEASSQRMKKYMAKLQRDVKRRLYELYKVDFKMFGYKYEID